MSPSIPPQPHKPARSLSPPPAGVQQAAEVDRAAAEFASLLGTDQDRANARKGGSDAADRREEPGATADEGGERQPGSDRKKKDEGAAADRKAAQPGTTEDDAARRGEAGAAGRGDEQVVALGDTILRGLSRGVEGAAAPTAPTAPSGRDATLDGIVQQVAEKILVSDPSSGQREIRIMLKESILPGTEVRITQHAGRLQIQMVTESRQSHEVLAQHQEALQQRLTEKLEKREVVVEVALDGQGQPDSDGRSRQQREIGDEEDAS